MNDIHVFGQPWHRLLKLNASHFNFCASTSTEVGMQLPSVYSGTLVDPLIPATASFRLQQNFHTAVWIQLSVTVSQLQPAC